MYRGTPIIFLLWGRHFDEVDAAIFVGELRTAGLCVKVLGLEGRPMSGTHGLSITPDLALGQLSLLAPRTKCIIMPCRLACLLHYVHDLRLLQFLQEAQGRQVSFLLRHSEVAGEQAAYWMAALQFATPLASLIAYPDTQDLVPFVRTLANHWSKV